MLYTHTSYGPLWVCQAQGCTVRCWISNTSLPGDQQTRDARHQLHELFDPIWSDQRGPFSQGKRPNKRGVRRDRAYWWLANTMGVEKSDAHFGMFTLEQCERAKAAIEKQLTGAAT